MYLCTRNRQNGQMKRLLYLIIICAIVALTMGCTKPDRDDEAVALSTKIVSEGLSDSNHALECVDSAEQVGVFTAVRANTIKAIVYSNAGRRRMAAYYAEKAIAAEAGQAVNTSADSNLYFKVRYVLADGAYINDENLNRDMLAQLLGTNAKYVVQAIRDCSHGETVGDFITRYRLEHVAHLLKTTDDPIGVIGELSGIPSRVTLSRLFRNAYGMTCREYRQVSQQKE